MNKVDHNLSQLINLALTADNNKEKNNSGIVYDLEITPTKHFDLPEYIEKSQSLGLDSRLVLTSEPPTNDLEIIKRNIPTDLSPAGRELFTCLQDCELNYQLSNKNRKGFLHRKARTTLFPTVKKELIYLTNLPSSALDHFFEEFINGFLRVKTLEEELEDEKVLENKIKKTEVNNYINYIRGFI